MILRNIELPAVQDLDGGEANPVVLEISLIESEIISLSAFYQGCTSMVGSATQKFLLIDVPQVIQLTPTDEITPQSWYLMKLIRHDGEQLFKCQVPSFVQGDPDPLTWEELVMIQDGIERNEIGINRLLPEDPEDLDMVVFNGDTQSWDYFKFDPMGVGDMHTAVYDRNSVGADMFLFDNLVGTYDCGAV